ncbi:transcript variant X2 [Nothobranchius furzeri]|uniref:Transcript variant X2 n=1 Tax=Nothobranchius furzeri TaxID=105023 RepID=A0A9D2Y652_NOTFU|nr:transcript variant X2 [Nothobranchius furzeri]
MRGILLLCLLGCVAAAPSQINCVDLAKAPPSCFLPTEGIANPNNSSLGNNTLNSTASLVKPVATTKIKTLNGSWEWHHFKNPYMYPPKEMADQK